MDVPSRQRPLVLLVVVILAQVLVLAFQIRRGRDVRLIRVWSAEVLTPPQRACTFVISKIHGAWFGYLDLRHARKENRELADEVGQLRLKNQELEGQAAEAGRLAKLLDFRQANSNVPMLAAEVIGASADSNSETIFINRGEHDGVRRNMAVVTPDGVVGKIFEAFSRTAQVLLITDRESGVGALLGNTRTHGVIKGTGDPLLWMDYVTGAEKVPTGEEILTSGEDKIFPKDLRVGTVVSTRAGLPFQAIQVEPAAHLNRLEEVLVLLSEQALNPKGTSEAAHSAASGANSSSNKTGNASSAAGTQGNVKVLGKTPELPAKKPTGIAKPAATNPPGTPR
ncbi:MAG TPA: rod shape-determining protein MreC [Candidatus Acidoferrales bacterium]|nr:rod shape-determining protein MreC [Candidatus Acidoferrales bacterium]